MVRFTILLIMLTQMLIACHSLPAGPDVEYVTGSVTYRERIALPGDAVVKVQLQDVSLADAPATVISKQEITEPGQVPIAFRLPYDPVKIEQYNRYAVQARIEQAGRLLFINDTHTPVITGGSGNHVEMLLIRVQQQEDKAGTELRGMFQYMADAPGFTDCRTGLSFPVAMEGAYLELERAYMKMRREPGEKLQVILRGRYLTRPSMEADQPQVHLIVDKLERFEPGICEPEADATLSNTWWRLTVLDGRPVTVDQGGSEPHLVLDLDNRSVRGNGGCNNFFGSYEQNQDSLTFSAMGATRKNCPAGMDTEYSFISGLEKVTHYRISGQVMELFTGSRIWARFEAVYF